jgi:hypothetical protein
MIWALSFVFGIARISLRFFCGRIVMSLSHRRTTKGVSLDCECIDSS